MEHPKFTKRLLLDALNRSIWTFLEALLSCLTIGSSLFEMDWINVLGVSGTAFVIAYLKCLLTGLPESKVHGEFQIEQDGENAIWNLQYNGDPYEILDKDTVTFEVKDLTGKEVG